jgi:excisionase family DNA binding protein
MDSIDCEVDGIGQGPELLVTVEEAARRLSLGRTTIYGLIAGGRLRTVTVGRSRRVSVEDLVNYVHSLRAESSSIGTKTSGRYRAARLPA